MRPAAALLQSYAVRTPAGHPVHENFRVHAFKQVRMPTAGALQQCQASCAVRNFHVPRLGQQHIACCPCCLPACCRCSLHPQTAGSSWRRWESSCGSHMSATAAAAWAQVGQGSVSHLAACVGLGMRLRSLPALLLSPVHPTGPSLRDCFPLCVLWWPPGPAAGSTDRLVDLVQEEHDAAVARGEAPALYGAKITGGGSGGAWLPCCALRVLLHGKRHCRVGQLASCSASTQAAELAVGLDAGAACLPAGTVCILGVAGQRGEEALQRVVQVSPMPAGQQCSAAAGPPPHTPAPFPLRARRTSAARISGPST